MRRMTLENVFGMSDERVIDTERPRPRTIKLPWWALVPVPILVGFAVARGQGVLSASDGLEWAAVASAALGVALFAARLEERIFSKARRLALGFRLVIAAVIVLAGLGGATFLVAQIAALPTSAVRPLLVPLNFLLWTASASLGAVVILVIELATRVFVSDFRRRIVFAVLVLLVLSFAFCGYVAVRTVALLEALRAGGGAAEMPQFFGYSLADLPLAESLLARPTLFAFSTIIAAGVATLPAVLSVCAKLAENVTERITPMMKAIERVSQGDRSVHLEEGGGDQFLSLALSFNEMVDKLYLGQRIERAFGQYVSKEVLDRIRAQRGGVQLPPELRVASVFFADIRGFTPISEKLPPELVVGLLNRYLEQVVPVVEKHQGFLNKFIGDGVVVVFNGPIDQPDHAERAALCGIALQRTISQLNAQSFFAEVGELQIGVGVATGPMLCGNIGTKSRLEYTVIGDTVNLASRMTGHAHGGEVWVSAATAQALPVTIPAAPSTPIKFKGKDNAVVPYCIWPHAGAGTVPQGRS
jgi:class 3 adenylate cyclase